MISTRDATPADAATLAVLGARSFIETFGHLYSPANLALFLQNHTPDRWAAELADATYAVRLAEADTNPAGYCKLGPPSLPFDHGTRPAIELRQFYVLAPWQGSGLAATLMAWAIATARSRGAQDLYLSVFTDNHRARRFYARYGFTEVGPYAFMVGDQADEDIVCRLRLDA